MRRWNWEMIAVAVTLCGVIYMVGKKEGTVTTEIKQNRAAIQMISEKLDVLDDDVSTILREQSRQVSYDM